MTEQRILASSAVMAAGTVFSRASGFIRSALLVTALGASLRGDLFTIANTLPNMVYILVAGGIFNAVLVPQLVRRIKADADGGDAYASRVITLSALFLGAVTILLMALAPLLLRVYLDDRYLDADRVTQLESIVDLTRWCLPQVFFYGMYVLVGQILNARGRFGPMMWAPIANNLLSVGILAPTWSSGARWARVPPASQRSTRARRSCSASARPSGSWPSSSCWCPTCVHRASPTVRGSTSATPSSRRRCRWASGRCSS